MKFLLEIGLVLKHNRKLVRVLVPVSPATEYYYLFDVDSPSIFENSKVIIDLTNRRYVKNENYVEGPLSDLIVSDNVCWAFKMVPLKQLTPEIFND